MVSWNRNATAASWPCLIRSIRRLAAASTLSGSGSSVGSSSCTSANSLPRVSGSVRSRGVRFTGTMNVTDEQRAWWALRYAPSAPATQATRTSLTVQRLARATALTAGSDSGSDHATLLARPAVPVQIVESLRVPSSNLRTVSRSPGAAEKMSTRDPPPASARLSAWAMSAPVSCAAVTTVLPAPSGLRRANRPSRPARPISRGASAIPPTTPETTPPATFAAPAALDRTRLASG